MDFIDPAIQDYAAGMTSPEPTHLQDLNRKTNLEILYPRMLSGHLQGRILSMIAHMVQPKVVLEVGTYTGYSALCFAEGLPEGGRIITLDINAELEGMVMEYAEKAGYADQIDMRIGEALELIPEVEETLDLVFLDADKANYTNYFDLVLPKLRPGGFILADNVLWSGRILDPKENDKETDGLRRFNEHVKAHPGVEQVLMPVRDGLFLIRKLP